MQPRLDSAETVERKWLGKEPVAVWDEFDGPGDLARAYFELRKEHAELGCTDCLEWLDRVFGADTEAPAVLVEQEKQP